MATVNCMSVRSAVRLSHYTRSYIFKSASPCFAHLSSTVTETNEKLSESDPQKQQTQNETKSGQTATEKTLLEEKTKLESQVTDLKDKYQRSLAEAENVRNRMMKQVDDAKIFGIQSFCKDLLDVSDILGKATESVPKDQLIKDVNPPLKNLYDGLTMTEGQLLKVFIKHGLTIISPEEGEKFNPYIHEAMFPVPSNDQEDGTVAIITKIGYKLHERTLRPALVGVYKR